MRSEVPQQAKTMDSQLQRLQSFVLDAVAPLTFIVEANAKGKKVDHRQAVNAAKTAGGQYQHPDFPLQVNKTSYKPEQNIATIGG